MNYCKRLGLPRSGAKSDQRQYQTTTVDRNVSLRMYFQTHAYGDRTFSYEAPHLWNSLPDNVRNSQSINIFKQRIKAHLKKYSLFLTFC